MTNTFWFSVFILTRDKQVVGKQILPHSNRQQQKRRRANCDPIVVLTQSHQYYSLYLTQLAINTYIIVKEREYINI